MSKVLNPEEFKKKFPDEKERPIVCTCGDSEDRSCGQGLNGKLVAFEMCSGCMYSRNQHGLDTLSGKAKINC